MKLVTFVRHADAEKLKKNEYDFERRLTKKGISDSKAMAKNLFKEPGFVSGMVMSSMAYRAISTARIIAKRAGLRKDAVQSHEQLYSNLSYERFLAVLGSLPEDVHQVIMVGHNPWIEKLATTIFPEFSFSVPKSSALSIRFDVMSWKEARKENAVFNFFKYLKDAEDLPKMNLFFAHRAINKIAEEAGNVVGKGSLQLLGQKKKSMVKETKDLVIRKLEKSSIVTVRSIAELKEMYEEWKNKVAQKKLKKAEKKEKKKKEKEDKRNKKRMKKEKKASRKKAKKIAKAAKKDQQTKKTANHGPSGDEIGLV